MGVLMNLEKINDKLNNEFELKSESIIFDNIRDTIWFSMKTLSFLFEVSGETIQNNVNDIFSDGELSGECSDSYKNIIQHIGLYPKKLSKGKKLTYYNMEMFNCLFFRLRSKKAIQFRIKVNKFLENIRNGELEIINNRELFESIYNKKTTSYRMKISQKQLQLGKSEKYVENRKNNVKLNEELRNFLNRNGLSGNIIKVQKKLGKIAYGMYPSEFKKKNNISNSHIIRDFCTYDQNKIIKFLEEELLVMLVNHEGIITEKYLYAYVNNCIKRGSDYSRILKGRISLYNPPYQQESLDAYI